MNQGKKKWNVTPYFYLIPSLLVFGVFLFYPFFKTVYLSLYKTNKMGPSGNCLWDLGIIKNCLVLHPF